MNIIAIDTCFGACSVAAGRDLDTPRARIDALFERRDVGHAERLLPMVQEALKKATLAVGDVDRIAVTLGPGTFTGTRIGVAAARALALASGRPVVATTSLAVMAQEAAEEIEDRDDAEILVAVDARRSAIYVQVFAADGLTAKSPPLLLTAADAARRFTVSPLLAVGSGAHLVALEAASIGRTVRTELPTLQPDACTLLYAALRLPVLDAPPHPLYLREADAKPQAGKTLARA